MIASLSEEGQTGNCLGKEHKYMRSDMMQGINIKKPSFRKGHQKFIRGDAGLSAPSLDAGPTAQKEIPWGREEAHRWEGCLRHGDAERLFLLLAGLDSS